MKKRIFAALAVIMMWGLAVPAAAMELPDLDILQTVVEVVEEAETAAEAEAETAVEAEAETAEAETKEEAPALLAEGAAASGTCGESATWTLSEDGVLTVGGTGKVTSGGWTFDKATVTAIVVEEGITELGDRSLADFSNVVSVTLPDTLLVIGEQVFQYCMKLRSVTVPEGVTSLGFCAFQYCLELGHLSLPASLTSIGGSVVSQCFELDHVSYAGTEEQWNAIEGHGNVFVADTYPIRFCFENDGSAVEHLDKCVTDIFYCGDCDGFVGGVAKKTPTHNYRGGVCRICGVSEEWSYSAGDMGAVTVTKYSGTATEVEVPSTFDGMPTRALGWNVFQNYQKVTRIVLPEGIESIGSNCFSSCYALADVNIPSTVKTIESSAFSDCYSLPASLALPDGLETVGSYAFRRSNLREITLPDAVTKIGNMAFDACKDLRCANLGAGITTIPQELFYNCTGLAAVSFSGAVTSIGTNAFGTCAALEHILFLGTEEQWLDMSVTGDNGDLFDIDAQPCYGESGDCLRLMSDGLYEYVYCTACGGRFGERELDLSYLDINNDGRRNAKDIVELMKSIVGAETDALESRVDVNADGERDVLDIIRLLRVLAVLQTQ